MEGRGGDRRQRPVAEHLDPVPGDPNEPAQAAVMRRHAQQMRERDPEGYRRFRLAMRIILGGLLAFLVLLFVFDVVSGGGTANLDDLRSEPVWSDLPPGGQEVLSGLGSQECDSMGDAVDLAQRIEVPEIAAAFEHYAAVLDDGGWTLGQRESGSGLLATKDSGNRTMTLWVTDISFTGRTAVEVRGTIDPDGC